VKIVELGKKEHAVDRGERNTVVGTLSKEAERLVEELERETTTGRKDKNILEDDNAVANGSANVRLVLD
jgi:hypothetical protein